MSSQQQEIRLPSSDRDAIPRSAVSVTEASRALGVSASTVYGLVATGTLRAKRIGRRIVIPVSAVHELLGDTVAANADVSKDVGPLGDAVDRAARRRQDVSDQ